MTCSSLPIWSYIARISSFSPENTKGGPGLHDCSSLGRKTESCNFSALVIPQGAAPFCLKTPAMTPCFNVTQQGIALLATVSNQL